MTTTNNNICSIYLQKDNISHDLELANDVAECIEGASKAYVERYWEKKTGKTEKQAENVLDETKPLKYVINKIEKLKKNKQDDSRIKEILDLVAKRFMHIYYNMLLPQKVVDP